MPPKDKEEIPEEELEIKKKKEEPPIGTLGEAGGELQPVMFDGVVYNPDTITVRTYLEMEDDAQIKAVLTLIKAPLLKVVWSITCDDRDVSKFCRTTLEPIWLSLVSDMGNALNFGHQAFEKVWKKDGANWVYDDFLDLYPGSVYYKKDKRGGFNGLQQYTTKGRIEIPPEKSFIYTNEKRWGNPYGRSKLRSAYFYWYVDKFTYDFENRFFERFAEPMIHGEAPSGKTQVGSSTASQQDNITGMLNILKAARNSGAIVTPSDVDPITKAKKWEVKFLEAQRRGADYIARHEYLDLMKARAIFAPELVFSAPYAGSSYALAREHATIFMSAEEAMLQSFKDHIDKYILPQLVLYNFGSKAPKAYWDYESIAPETRTLLRDLVMAMVAGDIIRPDPTWISKTIGIKLREEPTKEQERKIKSGMQQTILKKLRQGLKPKEELPEEEPEEEEIIPRRREPPEPLRRRPPPEAGAPGNQISRIAELIQKAKAAAGAGPTEPPGMPPGIMPPGLPGAPPSLPGMPPSLPGMPPGLPGMPPTPPKRKPLKGRSAAAFKRWATTPTAKRFRSPRAYEKAFAKGLFDDIQNHYLFGTKRTYYFDEDFGMVLPIQAEKTTFFKKKVIQLIEHILG